jgi:hypothetical protein
LKFSFSILKIVKFKFRRFVHFGVLVIEEYQYGEKTFHRNVKFYPRTANTPTAFQHLSLASSRTVRNRRVGPKTFVYTRVANLGDFSPKKANLGILLKNVLGFVRPKC